MRAFPSVRISSCSSYWKRVGDASCVCRAGSLFNHSQRPNVSYTIDPATESIRYTTSRRVLPDEELCIFYGHKLWFDPVDAADGTEAVPVEEPDDGWGGLGGVGDAGGGFDEDTKDSLDVLIAAFADGDPEQVVPEEELPFRRLKLTPEDEEEDVDAVRKGACIPPCPPCAIHVTLAHRKRVGSGSSRPSTGRNYAEVRPDGCTPVVLSHVRPHYRWLKPAGFDTPSMAHLKRIRKNDDKMTMLLILTREHPTPPTFPDHIELPPPYVVSVPKRPALTMTSLKLKSSLWPTIYAP